jgi:hypothetical protein
MRLGAGNAKVTVTSKIEENNTVFGCAAVHMRCKPTLWLATRDFVEVIDDLSR